MKKRRKSFTLVELLVAVGLLSLIMMLLLQLFSGAQKIWTSNEKTGNVYADARVAMELMADLLNTVQFSHGEDDSTGNRTKSRDMIFSLDTKTKNDGRDSGSIIFAASAASRNLPVENNPVCFVSFLLSNSDNTKGKLFMVVYSDKNAASEAEFYKYFPPYSSLGSSRDTAKGNLKTQMDALVAGYSSTAAAESEFCQVIAENVVAFKLSAYYLKNGQLEKKKSTDSDAADVAEPPYMIEIQLTVLDADSYTRWQEISDGTAKDDYLKQHQRTFSRNVFIGDRWALEAQDASSSGSGGGSGGGN
ncbi:MAG: prepilin-type N-terminal cleavage/methylation domain-containing protein [Lentisphaeria bacterium]|nr:prepilin-type N-terminal cleavage/methylation domain-containing protein [Lentisphaeria bacterium]